MNPDKELIYKTWVAENGQMRLDPNDMAPPFAGEDEGRVVNDNGILFLYYWHLLLIERGELDSYDKGMFLNLVEKLRVKDFAGVPTFGLYNRHPGNVFRFEAQDNMAAIAGSQVTHDTKEASYIVSFGEYHGFNYNNLHPEIFELSQQRQGGEIAYYKICAGYMPELWNWFWFLGGIIANAFQRVDSSQNNPSTTLLAWMRISVVSKQFKTTLYFPQFMRITFDLVKWFWQYKLNSKYLQGMTTVFEKYFIWPQHPCRRYSQWT